MIRRAYPEYKPSGSNEWLGEVPEHWDILRLKYAANLINTKIDGENSDLPYTGLENIESWTGKRIGDGENFCSGQANTYKSSDVLLGKLRPYLAKVYAPQMDGICSGELLVLRPRVLIQAFLRDYLLNREVIYLIDSSTYGAKMPRASWDFIGNLITLVPPIKEQRTITAFLDRETTRIDTLIEKKERQIELLQEKRSALISHAVTKGLDPSVKMKDSGIEWLGEVPEHWEMVKLRHLGLFCKGRGISRSDITDSGVPAITYGDIYTKYGIETKHLKKFTSEPVAINAQEIINGDLLFTASGETIEEIGKTTLYSGDEPAYAGGDIIILTLDEGHELYLSYVLNSEVGIRQKIYFGRGDIIVHISASNLKQLIVPKPPLPEQQTIANYLNRATAKIDILIKAIQKSINLLHEYRTTLISAAVTGKIDVRKEAA